VKVLHDGLDMVRSEQGRVDESWFDGRDDSVAEREVCKDGSQDGNTDSGEEQSKARWSALYVGH
jgi:hypothetical protein